MKRLNGADLEQLYRDANKQCDICPACLVERLPPAVAGVSQNDREHYFPQSIYPPLAVHPYNLTIACMRCNQRRHSNIDPIQTHGAGALLDSFLPYSRPGIDDIELKFNLGGTRRMVEICGKQGRVRAHARAKNFDRTYGLSTHWGNYLDKIDRTLQMRVSDGGMPTLAHAKQVLAGIVAFDERSKMFEPEAFLRARYAAWILDKRLEIWLDSIA